MKKWIYYGIVLLLAAAALAAFYPADYKTNAVEKTGKMQVTDLCANFTDYSGCKAALKAWEDKTGGNAYAVVEYRADGKSALKEGWILYLELDKPVGIPGTNETTYKIGVLTGTDMNASQIYEFVR